MSAGQLDRDALALRALDLLPYGVVACDARACLAFGNRIVDRMVGGLHVGQAARLWSGTYGLTDATGCPYRWASEIPLVAALNRAGTIHVRMRQRCGKGAVELMAHTRCVRTAGGEVCGAVGVFVPLAIMLPFDGPARPVRPTLTARTTPTQECGRSPSPDLLVAASIELAEEVTAPAPSADSFVEQVTNYVVRHQAEPIRLSEVAAAFGYNPSYLTTRLRRRTGESLTGYVLSVRLAAARRLLESTDLPIVAVAARTGPWEADYFGRLFRRRFGCSPSTWRDSVGGQQSSGRN